MKNDLSDTSTMFDQPYQFAPKVISLSLRVKVFLVITGLLIAGSIIDRTLFRGRSLINKVENLYSKIMELK